MSRPHLSQTQTPPLSELLMQHRPGHALPQPFYTSPEIFEADIEACSDDHRLAELEIDEQVLPVAAASHESPRGRRGPRVAAGRSVGRCRVW